MTADLRSVKHHQRFSYWIEKVRECRKSGLTVKEWCLQNGCNPSTYYKWQRLIFQGFQENSVSETVCTVADTASNCTNIVSATTNDCTCAVSDTVLGAGFAALVMDDVSGRGGCGFRSYNSHLLTVTLISYALPAHLKA